MPFYAVAKGRQTGVFMTWAECEAQVKGFSGARYKKFDTVQNAENFIASIGDCSANVTAKNSNISNVSKNNLKRTYSTTINNQSNENKDDSKQTQSEKTSCVKPDQSDDINTILMKELDNVEKRLKIFEKGVDKIINQSKKTILIDPPQPSKRRKTHIGGLQFEEDNDGYINVYTDGACSANGTQNARAGLGVYWGDKHPLNVSKPVLGRATNNCGEIQAATYAIKQAIENGVGKLKINTDSKFLIDSVTKWMPGWKRKGWKLKSGEPVKNEKDFKELDAIQNQIYIIWNYVEAHKGIHGNEMADCLAKEGANKYLCK